MTGSRRRASVEGASRTPARPARWREVRMLAAEPLRGRGRVSSRAKFVGSTVESGQVRVGHPRKAYRGWSYGPGNPRRPKVGLNPWSTARARPGGGGERGGDCQDRPNGAKWPPSRAPPATRARKKCTEGGLMVPGTRDGRRLVSIRGLQPTRGPVAAESANDRSHV